MNENNNVFGQSFESIVQAIKQKNEGTDFTAPVASPAQPSIEPTLTPTPTPTPTPPVAQPPVVETVQPVGKLSFEELVAQARNTAAQKGTTLNSAPAFSPAPIVVEEEPVDAPVVEEAPVVVETPVVEETPVEAPVEAPVATPVVEAPVVEDKTELFRVDMLPESLLMADADALPIMETPVVETPVVETPVVETPVVEPKKPVRKSRAKPKPATDTEATAPETTTVDTVVDVPVATSIPTDITEHMENVFGVNEVQDMRTLIHTWMRHEMKLAMVDAMKDIMRDFEV